MSGFIKKRFLLVVICILTATYSYSQIKVSEFIQKSEIASSDNNKLFFVDFWASWCGPCIIAKEHLGVLQKQFPNDFYIVSLSSENPLTVENFLKKKSTGLAVAIDYNKETFKRFNVRVLPDGVLFNAKGEVLWRGKAPDLKKDMVSRFLKQQSSSASLDSFFDIISEKEVTDSEYIPFEEIEIGLLPSSSNELNVVDNNDYLKVSGSLKSIVGYLAKIYKNQIVLEGGLDNNYEVYFKKPFNPSVNQAIALLKHMNLEVDRKISEGNGISLVTETPEFWDTDQINWGENNSRYLIGDSQIQADNVSLRDVAYQLAHVLDMPVVVPDDNSVSMSIHDWDFHYKFFQLMKVDLEDNYGIKAEKKTISYPVYYIQKKAP